MDSDSKYQEKQTQLAQSQQAPQQGLQQTQQQELNFTSKVGKYTQGIAMKLSKELKEQTSNVKTYVGQDNLSSKIKTDVATGFKNFFTQMAEGTQFLKLKAQRTKQYFKQDNLKQQLKTDTKETYVSIVSNVKNTYNGIVEGPGGISDTIKQSEQLTQEQYKDPTLRQNVHQDKENQPPEMPIIPFQEKEEQLQQQQQNLYQQENYQTNNYQQENDFDYIGGGQEVKEYQKNDDTDINKLN